MRDSKSPSCEPTVHRPDWESCEPPPHRLLDLKGQGNRHFWPHKVAVLHAWSRKGRSPGCCQSGGANDRPHCSNGREFTVISPEFLRPAGWDCFRRTWQAGIPGALRQSLGTAINLHDGLAIHRGEPEQSCGGPQPGSANFVRTDPRSRYGRKSWFSSQEAWLVHPVAWLVHPVACSLHPEGVDSAGPPRARRGVPLPPRIVPRRGTWWAPPR